MNKLKLALFLAPYINMISKSFRDCKISPEFINYIENIGGTLHGIKPRGIFSNLMSLVKQKLHQIKKYLSTM